MAVDTALDLKHLYKISDKDGNYLGVLQKVKSDFGYTQQINTVVSQLTVEVGQSIDTAEQTPDPILDETGAVVLDERGDTVYADGATEVIGDSNPNILIQEDNLVEVLEFSPYAPNGVTVFKGYISQVMGEIDGEDDVQITVLTRGQDADNIEIPGDVADTLDQSQTQTDGEDGGDIGSWYTSTNPGDGQRYGQSFTVGVGVTNISAIALKIATNYPSGTTPRTITLKLWSSVSAATPSSGASPLGIVSMVLSDAVYMDRTFRFASPIDVTPGQVLFFTIDPDPSSTFGDVSGWLGFGCKTADVYAGGILCRRNSSSGGAYLTPFNYDFYFKTYYSSLTTEHAYNADVSDILTDVMEDYNTRSGSLQIPAGGYDPTGIVTPYTFKLNTSLEGINKVLELGPSDWHAFADVATEELIYEQDNTTADHTLLKGKHLNDLKLTSSKEEIINVCYVTGGPDVTGNNNVFVKIVDAVSLANNRIGLARLTDNRASGADGPSIAQLLAQNYINRHNAKTYNTTVTIPYTKYNINLFKPGQMVGFGNFGTSVDDLLLQVVAIQRLRDQVTLTLGTLPRRDDRRVEQLDRQLTDLQTLANPDAPS